ncbi:MAG: aminotransferase class V-fold PLP-dependent enzyme [bacterium]
MTIDTEQLRREEFAWMNAGGSTYMNAASTGPSPRRSVDAQIDFVRRRAAPHLVDFDDQFGTLDRCRVLLAQLIGATTGEIALATNTGAGINLAAWGLPLGPGDEVVVPDGEFPANMYPWLAAAKSRGYALHVVPLRDGVLDEEALLAALDRPNVRALSISWVGFSSGARANLDRLGAACLARDIYFIVDAIQGLGGLTMDVSRTHVDIIACGGQKWLLSPWGTGFTYVRRAVLDSVTPQPVSWMGVRYSDDFSRLVDYDLTWRDNARRFEQVTLAYQDFAGMAASLELLRELGAGEVSSHIHASAHRLLDGALARGIPLVTSHEYHGGIASIRPADATAASARLEVAGVIHSVREGTIRLAPHCYTTEEDLARTLLALEG